MLFSIVNDWDYFLDVIPPEKKDIYFSKKYVSLYEDDKNTALCAVCKEDNKIMLMPFLRGKIENFYDFETAYGYGGPISNSCEVEWCSRAYRTIYEELKKRDYLCGFTRFHPLLQNVYLTGCTDQRETTRGDCGIQILYDRKTVAINTEMEQEQIWNTQLSSKNRNMIRKAEKSGLIYKSEFGFESFDEFIDLYIKTMKRLNANDFYFFDLSYFKRLKGNLKDSAFLGTIRKDGKLICSAIFMYSDLYGHYHLEGSDRDYSSTGANNLLLWKAACEMHRLGVREFNLGGGTSSDEDDTLLKFKKVFSRDLKDFYIGKEIFNGNAYQRITKEWERENKTLVNQYGRHLLKYRYRL